MANKDMPRGYEPYGDVLRKTSYVAGARICPGELVKKSADGKLDPAASNDACIGVALSYASGNAVRVDVADHPDQYFVVQADGSDLDTQTDIGLNYANLATADNTVYNTARMELDSSTGSSTDASRVLKLIDIVRRPDNAFGAQVDCIVKINNHQHAGGSGVAGV